MRAFETNLAIVISLIVLNCNAQNLPSSIEMKDISGGTFTMGSNSLMGSPDQQTVAPEHEVTISSYAMSEAETTNAQYVEFLNTAFICDYQDYDTTPMQFEGPILNDFDDWAGSGQNLSNELEGWTENNTSVAVNLQQILLAYTI